MERGGKAPGAAALAADEQDRLGASRGLIAPDARPPPPSREPDDNASHAHGRDAERHQPQNEAKRRRSLSGVQHVDGLRYAFPPGQVGPGQQRTGALIEIPGPPVGLQREDVRRIAGIGKAQLPQFVDGRLHQKEHLTRCEPRLAAHLNRHGWHAATGKQIEGGRRHPQGGGGRQDKADHRDAGDLDMQPASKGSAQPREPVPPAAHTPGDQQDTGKRQHQHRRGTHGHGDAPAIAEEQRAVQVGKPALRLVGVGGGHTLTSGGVDHCGAGRALIEPVGRDPARGRAADLLDARIGALDAIREGGHRHARLGLRRGNALGRREDRQRRAAQG